MADNSKTEWTDASWNPIRARFHQIQNDGSGKERLGWHCEKASDGCRNCYAEGINRRLGTGLDYKPGNLFREEKRGYHNGEAQLFLDEAMLLQPLKWKRPRMIFVCSMTDLFADFVPDAWIDKVFAVMALCPQHTFQVLTKRSARMLAYFVGHHTPRGDGSIQVFSALQRVQGLIADYVRLGRFQRSGFGPVYKADWDRARDKLRPFPLLNVWLGVSAERQQEADARIPDLLATPAAVRFVSLEPLLGPINLQWLGGPGPDDRRDVGTYTASLNGFTEVIHTGELTRHPRLDWVIVGGESGPAARPMHPDWARDLRDHCAAAGVPFFFKQWGAWKPICNMPEAEFQPLYKSNRKARDGESQDNIDDIYGRTCIVETLCLRDDGAHCPPNTSNAFLAGTRPVLAFRVGKKAAGRLLDGVEHNGMPAAAQRSPELEPAA